jgi:hypothetical protein
MSLRPRVITARDASLHGRSLIPIPEDHALSKIVKYIPAEMVALYTALRGIIIEPNAALTSCSYYELIFIGVLILTPIYMYIATREEKKETPWFQVCIAAIAFCIWVYSFGDVFQWCWILFDGYSAKLGAVVLLLFTASVPVLEKIFIRPVSDQANDN